MTNKKLFLILICSFLTFIQGCKKDDPNDATKTIYVSIKTNQTYQYNLGSFGDEEGAGITRQASHFQVSQLERINYVNVVYTYKPLQDFNGIDVVELKAERGSDGVSPNDKIIVYIFNISIAQ